MAHPPSCLGVRYCTKLLSRCCTSLACSCDEATTAQQASVAGQLTCSHAVPVRVTTAQAGTNHLVAPGNTTVRAKVTCTLFLGVCLACSSSTLVLVPLLLLLISLLPLVVLATQQHTLCLWMLLLWSLCTASGHLLPTDANWVLCISSARSGHLAGRQVKIAGCCALRTTLYSILPPVGSCALFFFTLFSSHSVLILVGVAESRWNSATC